VNDNPDASLSDIGQQIDRSKTTVSNYVRELEQDGRLQRNGERVAGLIMKSLGPVLLLLCLCLAAFSLIVSSVGKHAVDAWAEQAAQPPSVTDTIMQSRQTPPVEPEPTVATAPGLARVCWPWWCW
jgi:DNA-binding Lrp family transcriptional regulator